MPDLLNIIERPQPADSQYECVEIYLPKRLRHLSELYDFLREKVEQRVGAILLEGFSIYEVDGVFHGAKQLWEERTLVIRTLLPPSVELPAVVLQGRINELGRDLCMVAGDEEEIWISNYPQTVTVFKPAQVERAEGGVK
jgi:hypothetical protein